MAIIINFKESNSYKAKETEMANISVKTAEGRVAYDGPYGKKIPSDKFVSVRDTPYVRRLIDHHHDLIVEGEAPPTRAAKPAPIPTGTEIKT